MKTIPLLMVVSLLASARFAVAQANDADKAKFEQKFNAKIIKTFDTDNPTEGLAGGTGIAVAYSGVVGNGQKYYVAYCEKNDQNGYGSAWIYRSADEGATWTQVPPSTNDIPAAYQNATWLAGKPTFASQKAWIRMAAYEANKPKSFPAYLSGYWSSSGTTVYTGTDPNWVLATGSNADLVHVPVCVYRGTLTTGTNETALGDGMYEAGTITGGDYTSRYAYRYNFKVPRSGWGSGLISGTTSGTDAYEIIPSTITGTSFEATYYHFGNCKRTFTRDSSPTSQGPSGKPAGAADPHYILTSPAGLASYTPPPVPASSPGSSSGLNQLTGLVPAYQIVATGSTAEAGADGLRDGTYFGSLFFYDGSGGGAGNIGLYLISLGHSEAGHKLCIRKSQDAGATWSAPHLLSNKPGDFDETAPAIYGGRVWIAFGSTQVISASLFDDLTQSSSWVVSEDSGDNYKMPRVTNQDNFLANKPPKDLNFRITETGGVVSLITDLNSLFPSTHFSESNLVAGADDSGAPGVWLLPKIAEQPYTARIGVATGTCTKGVNTGSPMLTTKFSVTGTTVYSGSIAVPTNAFNPDNDIVFLPGAGVKFAAQYVSGTGSQPGKFYALTNPELEPYQCSRLVDRDGVAFTLSATDRYNLSNYENPGATRNTGAIYTSTNLKEWHLEKIFVHSAASELVYAKNYGKVREGFSTFSFAIDGDDMLIVSRTAADIGQWEDASIDYTAQTITFATQHFPTRSLDANLATFHRVKNFRNLTRDTFLAADEDANKVFLYEATNGDPAKVGEFRLPGETGVSLPSGLVQSGSTGDVFISKCTSGGTIERYARDGPYSSRLCTFPAGSKPVALTMGSASNLLYALVSSGTNANLYKVTIPTSGTGTPTLIPTLTSGSATVNLAAQANGLAVASTGFIYGSTPSGFARISTTGGTVAVTTSPVQALSRGGSNLYVVQTGTSSVLNFSTLSNTTLTPLSTGTFAAPTTGLSQTGTSLYFTGSATEGWEMLSTPLP